MQDKTRLAITGAVAVVALAATVGGHNLHFNADIGDDDDKPTTISLPSLKNFDGVTLKGSDDVVVARGSGFAVNAEGDKDALDRLNIYVKDGTLFVERKDSRSWLGSHDDGGATIHVTLPALTHVGLTGSGDMSVDRLDGAQVKAEVTGPGSLSIDGISADNAELALTGSGDLTAGGTAKLVTLRTTGSGNIDARQLTAEHAALALIGSGDVDVRATRGAEIDIKGSGDAKVTGTTACKLSKTGSGEAECSTS